MPSTFELNNPSNITNVEKPFGVRSQGVPAFECLRLLCGIIDLKHNESGKVTKLRYCNLSHKTRRMSNNTIKNIVQLGFDNDLDINSVKTYLTKAGAANQVFWKELRSELCFCILAQKKRNNVEAFLHLYRILELISVALPLIYVTKLNDFRDAVNFIKSLTKNDRDQDLAILKYFSAEIAKNSDYETLTIDYKFEQLPLSARTHLVHQLNSYVLNDPKIKHEWMDEPNEGVSVNFTSVSSFMVSCRNRLFHNAMSNENFKLDLVGGSSNVCSVMIKPGLYWFGLVLSEILKAEASRYV